MTKIAKIAKIDKMEWYHQVYEWTELCFGVLMCALWILCAVWYMRWAPEFTGIETFVGLLATTFILQMVMSTVYHFWGKSVGEK